MRTRLPFYLSMIILSSFLFSCGSGLVVRASSEWDRTDWYGKRVILLPGLGAAGIRFSDPNPNDAIEKHLKTRLPRLPKYSEKHIQYLPQTLKQFSEQGHWASYKRLQFRFIRTGRVDITILQDLGQKMGTDYFLLPLYLSSGFTSWEPIGVFSYYSAAVELILYSVQEKNIVFRARARGYSIGDLEKAYSGACEEVVKVFR